LKVFKDIAKINNRIYNIKVFFFKLKKLEELN